MKDRNAWVGMLQYAACFGCEVSTRWGTFHLSQQCAAQCRALLQVAITNIIGLYFYDNFLADSVPDASGVMKP